MLGLSATPWSNHVQDSDRQKNLKSKYGDIIGLYGIEEALADEVLCQYSYEVVPVRLSDQETHRYLQISRELARLLEEAYENLTANQKHELEQLYRSRQAILDKCENKLIWLDGYAKSGSLSPRTLVYVGEGNIGESESQEPERLIRRVSEILRHSEIAPGQITSQENLKKRLQILDSFARQQIDCILAMKVLDEGFDLPSVENAIIMASRKNERQFIQRRGRVLRQSPETGKTSASITDLLVIPNQFDGESGLSKMVEDELIRALSLPVSHKTKPRCIKSSRLSLMSTAYQLMKLRKVLNRSYDEPEFGE